MSTFVFTNHHGEPHRDTAEHRGLRLVIAEADHPSAAIEERHAVMIFWSGRSEWMRCGWTKRIVLPAPWLGGGHLVCPQTSKWPCRRVEFEQCPLLAFAMFLFQLARIIKPISSSDETTATQPHAASRERSHRTARGQAV